MATFAQFEPLILPWCNAPLPAIEDCVRLSAIRFCEQSSCLVEIKSDIDIVSGTADYTLSTAQAGLEVHLIKKVLLKGVGVLQARNKIELESLYPNGWIFEEAFSVDQIECWFSPLHNTVKLVPKPMFSATAVLSAEMVLKPTRSTQVIPDLIFSRYADAVADGALAILHATPDEVWAKPDRVAMYQSRFDYAVNSASDHHAQGFGRPRYQTGFDRI